ncbi:helix-turn-helix transcriptional regulator [Nitrosomonas sp. Nm34]|uniref:ArsR/SmtB family transcription factor n=1 Tax=Nitrosomonas sp. Nm34 TaxID=1881055 RepID=UPI0020C8E656|nr:metalloregulator ArsR/SmtB family transcription factor [Nitrosomonas sp. Nm34]
MLSNRASAAQACALLKALANEDRLLILCQLAQGEKNVGELEQSLGIRQPTLSQQLTVLREEKLVNTERKGKYIYYCLASQAALHIMQTLYDLYCTDHSPHPQKKSSHLKLKKPIPSGGEKNEYNHDQTG